MALKDDILTAGLAVAARFGIAATTREAIAYSVPCANGSVSHHLGDAKHIRRAIVEAGIAARNLRVVGWAIAERHPSVQGDKIDAALRAEALKVHLGR